MSRKNRATVLVIEADDAIRSTIEWLLSEHGYDVRVARTCAEALTAESAGRLDLVLSDIVAAGPDGPIRVAGKLGARLIFMAGSGDQFIAKRALEREGVWLLPKPFSPAALVKTLEEVLDA